MAVNDIFACSMIWDVVGGDGNFVNTMHYRQTGYDGISSDAAMGAVVAGFVGTLVALNYLPAASNQITLNRVDWFIVNKPTTGGTVASGVVGGVVAEMVALRSAPVVKKITALRGRSFRGRMFLPPVGEANQANGVLNAAILVTLQTFVDSIMGFNDGAGNTWGSTVYSPTLSDPGMGSFIDNIITSFVISAVMGSLRGRQVVT